MIVIDPQGVRGKKVAINSIPWKSVTAFSRENAGTLDLDTEWMGQAASHLPRCRQGGSLKRRENLNRSRNRPTGATATSPSAIPTPYLCPGRTKVPRCSPDDAISTLSETASRQYSRWRLALSSSASICPASAPAI
ncbi:MAG: hypothetical protein F4Y08_14665 [Caldilineaceae bacterium SB0662_bin_9]|uniref:Bacterial Pleckstrin homology domain-containing protein n=1 Tax=Caldilineaceae bacterium SB0662_bin_9 TaxID=2605258 RepID=A0A6B1DV03_9CHLR|nr:hypothetical protein [Caldilineaceae bacterium SB0662_bin_9]